METGLNKKAVFVFDVIVVLGWDFDKWSERLQYISENADTIADEIKKMSITNE